MTSLLAVRAGSSRALGSTGSTGAFFRRRWWRPTLSFLIAACLLVAAQDNRTTVSLPFPGGVKQFGGADVIHALEDTHQLILENRSLTIRGDAELEYLALHNARLKVLGQGSAEPTRPAALPYAPVLKCQTIELYGESTLSADYIQTDRLLISSNSVVEGGRQQLPLQWGDDAYEDPSIPGSYGGQGALIDRDQIVYANPTHGSFAEPFAAGGMRKSIRIDCRELIIDGKIVAAVNADQVPSNGAVWINTGILKGGGLIDASARGLASQQGQGGGRIAVYYSDATNWSGVMEAHGATINDRAATNNESPTQKNPIERLSSGGTIYTQSVTQRFGDLTIGRSENARSDCRTPLVSMGQFRIEKADEDLDNTLEVRALPPGLAGLYLVIETPKHTLEYRIIDSQYDRIQVEANLPVIPVGSLISAKMRLNDLHIERGSVFYSRDPLFIHGRVLIDEDATVRRLVQAPQITMPERPSRIDRGNDGSGGIVIESPRGN